MKIKITPDDIAYAEKVLLKPGETFDEERVEFITNLETLDLQAVPGSGKTTALLAKLLILERYLPLKNGSGILVLSHTNAAVDEIKDKIGKHCPQLFSYPHFIGTIQQFVNRFLAIPCANNLLKLRVSTVDTGIHELRLCSRFQTIYWDKEYGQPGKYVWGRQINRARAEAKKSGLSEKAVCDALIESEVKGLYLDLFDKVIKTADGKTFLKDVENEKYKGFLSVLFGVLKEEGIISFRYAYHLAEFYVHHRPDIASFLRNRFAIIFVDEMQDMAKHQHDLLETLFYSSEFGCPVFQRIGDKNQAIYSSKIETENVWTDRELVLSVNGSYRLSQPVAEVVKHFSESYQDIDARGSAEHLPVILTYSDDSISQVVPRFASLIKESGVHQIPDSTFHVVGWVKNPEKRLSVGSYWENFEPQNQVCAKECYSSLSDYIVAAEFSSYTQSFKPLERLFVAAILEVLRLDGIKHPVTQRAFTRTTLFAYLREDYSETYDDIRLHLYQWSRAVVSETEFLTDIKEFLEVFLMSVFGSDLSGAAGFINSEPAIIQFPEGSAEINSNEIDGVKITVGTVHSVKGKTHTATLYLETFNGEKNAWRKHGYDSLKLKEQFEGEKFADSTEYKIKNTRVAYVGMSRPTHLLCVAIHKDRLPDIDSEKWDVVDVEMKNGSANDS